MGQLEISKRSGSGCIQARLERGMTQTHHQQRFLPALFTRNQGDSASRNIQGSRQRLADRFVCSASVWRSLNFHLEASIGHPAHHPRTRSIRHYPQMKVCLDRLTHNRVFG